MSEFISVRDRRLSLWASAVAEASAEAAARTEGSHRFSLASPSDPAVDATAEYLAAADPAALTGAPEAPSAQRQNLGLAATEPVSSDAEVSALAHQLAEAIGDRNTPLESFLRRELRERPGIPFTSWMASVANYLRYYVTMRRQPYYRSWQGSRDDEGKGDHRFGIIEWKIPSNARIAVVADWGTGRDEAIVVLKALVSMEPDLIVHLGDVYYSGTPEECRAHFLEPMRTYARKPDGTPIPVFTIPGNHDYYSGGEGFYELIDQLNEGPQRQRASYFTLRSEDGGWQFLAMDTGYNDHTLSPKALLDAPATYLRPDEIQWQLFRIADPDFHGRTILLSHHQFFSATDRIGDGDDRDSVNQRLLNTFKSHQRKIALALWGHEHHLMIFEPFMGIERGRCIGHGAVPVSSTDDPYSHPKYEHEVPFKRDVRLGTRGGSYNHGFTMIELRGAGRPASVVYHEVIENDDLTDYMIGTVYQEEVA